MAEGPEHTLWRFLQVILFGRRCECHDHDTTVGAKGRVLHFRHVMHKDKIARAHHKHALSLLVDHVGVGCDLAQHLSTLNVVVVDGPVAFVV